MLTEFREYLMRGNVVDLAVAVIIGAAFGGVVTSMVTDVLMPPIGVVTGGLDFKDHFIVLSPEKADAFRRTSGHALTSLAEARATGIPVIAYGAFINSVTNLVIITACLVAVVKATKHVQKPHLAAVDLKACPRCLSMVPSKASRCRECAADI